MLLDVENLVLQFRARDRNNVVRTNRVLSGVSFHVDSGEVLGVVGESGSGKSMTINAVLRLLPRGAELTEGVVRFNGVDMGTLSDEGLRQIRGNEISVITQSPLAALDPLKRIGDQLIRVKLAHSNIGKDEAARTALAMLERVGIPDPERRMRAWPHELSGGMAQRVVIAMALMNDPKLLVADEPTTGLDATVQIQVLNEFRRAVTERNLGAILVTHDMGVVARYCDRVAVMYQGVLVEQGTTDQIFNAPTHPYTAALLAAARNNMSVDHIPMPPAAIVAPPLAASA